MQEGAYRAQRRMYGMVCERIFDDRPRRKINFTGFATEIPRLLVRIVVGRIRFLRNQDVRSRNYRKMGLQGQMQVFTANPCVIPVDASDQNF